MKDNKIQIYRDRTKILLGLFISLLFIALTRFFYLQIIEGNDLRELREQNINTFEYIYPKRGRILSSDNVVLAEDRKIFSLAVDLEQKPSEEALILLTKLFPKRLDLDELRNKVSESLRYRKSQIILEKIEQADLAKILVRSREIRGFSIIEGYEREYNSHPSIFHVLGHMGYINEPDISYFTPKIENFNPKLWQKVGKSGIERVYEEKLQGNHGKRFFQRNARGDRRVTTNLAPFQEGDELEISINFSAQKLAFELMQERKGSVVVIDLEDFSIPVAISTPSISANDLKDISTAQYQDLLNDPSRPLFNRAFMGLYPPASTIKPLLTVLALSNKYTDWDETILDDGFFTFEEEQRVFNAWREGGHGITDLKKGAC